MSNHNAQFNGPKWLMPVLAITGLLGVILYALGILGGPERIEPGAIVLPGKPLSADMHTFRVGKQATANTLSWQGVVRSRMAVKISPRLNARILEIPVNTGDKVKKGAVIARLDDRELRAAYDAANAGISAAQAQAGQADADAARSHELFEKEATTRQNHDAVMARAKSARAMLSQAASTAQQAKVMLGENILYAPFDGVISERLMEPGDMVMPGQPVVLIYKSDDMRFEAAVAEHCFDSVRSGMSVNVKLDAGQAVILAQIDEIAPEIDTKTHTRLVKASLPVMEGLQHGQYGWMELGCQDEQQTLLVPASALVHYGQLEAVRVVEGDRLHTRHIRTGKHYGDQIEVLSGLHDGETILSQAGSAQ